MLDTRKIGAYISMLRKEANLTQLELAEQLNVSHQAVSKWERGEALPDIGTLLELAAFFNTTTDDILNARAHRAATHQQISVTVQEQYADHSPDQVSALAERNVAEHEELASAVAASINDRPELHDAQAAVEKITWDSVQRLAPFLSNEALTRLVERVEEKPTVARLPGLAPFLSREQLETFVLEAEGVSWNVLPGLAPFISADVLGRLVERVEERPTIARLQGLAPFLSREQLETFVLEAEGVSWNVLPGLAPFISADVLSRLVERVEEKPTIARLQGLAPFLSREHLDKHLATL